MLVDEGFPLSKWEVTCSSVADVKSRTQEELEKRKTDTRLAKLERLNELIRKQFPKGGSKNAIKEASSFSGSVFAGLFAELVDRGSLEPCKYRNPNNKQEYEGWRPFSRDTLGNDPGQN